MIDRDLTMRRCYEIPGQTWPIELGWLYDTFKTSKRHAEIGTYCGRSLIASISGMEDANVFCCDADLVSEPVWATMVRRVTIEHYKPDSVNVVVSGLNSIDFARHMAGLGEFDSVFIDGCHEYAETKADIEAWMTLLRPGGIIAGHDYWPVHAGVMYAVNEVFNGNHEVFAGSRIWSYRL
jgi:predicted O-methyltransferase YrrM